MNDDNFELKLDKKDTQRILKSQIKKSEKPFDDLEEKLFRSEKKTLEFEDLNKKVPLTAKNNNVSFNFFEKNNPKIQDQI